jgi:hypothetical protein
MNTWRQLLVTTVVVGMLHLTIVDVACSAERAALPNPTSVKQQVDQFGLGAKVKIRLANGKKLNGTIQAIEEDAFLVVSKEPSPTSVAYDQVAQKDCHWGWCGRRRSNHRGDYRHQAVAIGIDLDKRAL